MGSAPRPPHLTQHYSSDDLRGKRVNKERLTAAPASRSIRKTPLIGMVTRLASQKGIDMLMDALPEALRARDFGLVVLGSGDERYARSSSRSRAASRAASRFTRATTSRWRT